VDAIGGRRSSGLGRVRVEVHDLPAAGDLAERLRTFNAAFRERWALMADASPTQTPAWSPVEWTLFSAGLQTEAVLLEGGWRPAIVCSPAQLAAAELAAEPVRAWASARVAGGWNIRWNRHRPTALTVPAGTVYLFRTRADETEVVAALKRLEEQGIGARRAEGYGIVRCCDEFHVQAPGGTL
jgi:CRISPR-associated protein Csx10